MTGLTYIDYSIVGAYLVGILAMGTYLARGQKGSEGYFLAGRSMGWFPIAISLVATLVSTTSFLAYPSEAYGHDLKIMAYIFAVPLALLIIQRVFIPLYMKMNITSAYEYLEKRFNLPLRTTTSILFVVMRLIWMAVAVYAASIAVIQMIGLPKQYLWVIIFAVGFLASVYTTIGGMKAVIWTDVIQFFIFFAALAGACIFVIVKMGGISPILDSCAQAGKFSFFTKEFFTPDPRMRISFWSAILNSFVWVLAAYGSDQLVIQRYLSSRNSKEAKRSLWGNFVFGDIFLGIFQVGAGLALFAFYAYYTDLLPIGIEADKVFPYFIAHQLPQGISGLILAALFAAIMSSIDSGINSIAAVGTVDFYRRFSRRPPSDRAELLFARILTPILGVITCLLAISFVSAAGRNIIERTNRTSGFLIGPILGIFVLGLFVRRANSWGTIIGAGAGMLAGLLAAFGHKLPFGMPEISMQLSSTASLSATLLVGWLASYFWPAPAKDKLEGMVYRSEKTKAAGA